MEVTETTIRLVEPPLSSDRDGVLAFVSIVLNNELAIKGIRLVRVRGKILASMPNKERQRECPTCYVKNDITNKHCHACGSGMERFQTGDRVFIDMVHPVNSRLRQHLEDVLIQKYEEAASGHH